MARIAVVDDDLHLRKLLETLLNRRGHQPVCFADGAEALLEVGEGGFDLVLSDVQMPRLDGISLCKALRERWGKVELPIVLLSVLDKEDDILRAMEAGASDYLVKPYSLSLLQAKVNLHLADRSSQIEAPPARVLEADPVDFPYPFHPYVLLGELGRGGYAAVYKARRIQDGKLVAVKLLAREINADREALARYFREVAHLSRVHSPNVVRIHTSGFEQGRYYLTMDLVEGLATDLILREEGLFDVERALRIGEDVARAVGVLHEAGLVHRDIKPGNIILDGEGRAILIDLGLAKGRTDLGLTSPEDILGTPEYIAPEVVQGRAEHVGSDLYSLGVSLYELLVGAPPFVGATPYETLVEVATGRAALPAQAMRSDLPDEVSDLIAWLMDPDPDRRLSDPRQAEAAFARLRGASG